MPDSPSFDVFLCHNSADKPAVKAIGEQLRQRGIRPWLDEWELRPGLPWQEALEAQIATIGAAAVFVGPSGIGPWQDMELNAYLRQFVQRHCPVIPVILPGVPGAPTLPLFLGAMTWVDFRLTDPDPLERLIWGITGKRVQPQKLAVDQEVVREVLAACYRRAVFTRTHAQLDLGAMFASLAQCRATLQQLVVRVEPEELQQLVVGIIEDLDTIERKADPLGITIVTAHDIDAAKLRIIKALRQLAVAAEISFPLPRSLTEEIFFTEDEANAPPEGIESPGFTTQDGGAGPQAD
jgi:hypothetical protein